MRRPVQGRVFRGRDAVLPSKFSLEMKDLAQQGVLGGRSIVIGGRKCVFTGSMIDSASGNTVHEERKTRFLAKPVTEWKVKKARKRSSSTRKVNQKAKLNRAVEYPKLRDLEVHKRLNSARIYFRAPSAPHNTTSYLMRAKTSGSRGPLVSPFSVSASVVPTPIFSPSLCYREGLADEVHNEWGVNGYGSMEGLIRRRSLKIETGNDGSENDCDRTTAWQSLQQLEKKLDQDVSRFEMVYFPVSASSDSLNPLEEPCHSRDNHITHLEEENRILKDRLYLMKQELNDLSRRMQILEGGIVSDDKVEILSEISIGGT